MSEVGKPERNFASGTIWTGDNLEIMRGMNSACVDLIYLDPPFNSNRTYSAPIGSVAAGAAFKDAWTLDDVDEFEHGELAERNPAAGAVIEAARLAHGKPMMAYLIFMAVRLLEMRRVLKPTGSIYLHCDDTAGHWLRVLMESVFEAAAFRNEVIWKRIGNHNDAGRFGRTADRLLFYGATIHRDAVRGGPPPRMPHCFLSRLTKLTILVTILPNRERSSTAGLHAGSLVEYNSSTRERSSYLTRGE